MSIVRKFIRGLMYAGLDEEDYKLIKYDFIKANERILLWLSIAMSFTMGIIGILVSVFDNTVSVGVTYLLCAAVNVVIAITIAILGNRSLKAVQALSYLFSIALYATTIYSEAFYLPKYPSVAFVIFVVSLPAAFSARPIVTSGMAGIASTAYLVVTYITKPYSIWMTDLYNLIAFGIIGFTLNLLLNKFKTGEMLLEHQNYRMRQVLESRNRELQAINVVLKSGDMNILLDEDGHVCGADISNECCRLLGYRDADDMQGGFAGWYDKIHDDDRDNVVAAFKEVIEDTTQKKSVDTEFRARGKDGNYMWLRMVARVIRDNDNKPVSIWGLLIDIRNKKIAERSLLLELSIVETLSRDYRDVFVVNLDADTTTTVKVNGKMVDNFEQHMRKYSGTWEAYAAKYIHPDDSERVIKTFAPDILRNELREKGEIVCNYRVVIDNIIQHFQVKYFYVPGSDLFDEFIVSGYRNIDSIVAVEEEYQRNLQAAITEANETREVLSAVEIDNLTGTYTRQAFLKRAKDILDTNQFVSYDLLITDFEDFKLINDHYGTKMGDDLLAWFGKRIREAVGELVLVGRYSGDQFVVLIEDSILRGNDDIRSRISGNIQAPGLPMVTVKNGLYCNVNHDQAITVLCDRAHMALSSIKHKYGQDYALYDENIKKQMEIQRAIERSMHKAIEEGQFRVYYQPKHNSATDEIVGAEALIRWEHPEYGFMSPGEFIPLFEKNGFITEADCFVWEKTCENIRKWRDKGLKSIPISVNASKIDFLHENFLTRLDKAAEKEGIPKDLLHVEVTETLMTDEVEALAETLNDFKNKGYKIELDDFGVGYSSLNILSALPIDVVKLDMSFMRHFKDIKKSKILEACITLAKNLGLKTVSEGVETREQIDMLNDMGIDSVQGYYYSKPLPEEEFVQYLERYTK